MDKKIREEMISAYLDGELDATQAEHVAKWLREDPQAQKMLEEFQHLREAIQGLPPKQLKKNLASSVLDQIQSLEEYTPATPILMDSSPEVFANPSLRKPMHYSQRPVCAPSMAEGNVEDAKSPANTGRGRKYLWPAVVLAAAVLLMVFTSRETLDEDRSIARTEPGAEDSLGELQSETFPARPRHSGGEETVQLERRREEKQMMSAAPQSNHHLPRRKNIAANESRSGDSGKIVPKNVEATAATDAIPQAFSEDSSSSPTTYFFRASPEVDLKKYLQQGIRGPEKKTVIDLGAVYQDTESSEELAVYRIFELYGSSEEIHATIEKLQGIEGITPDTSGSLRGEYFENQVRNQQTELASPWLGKSKDLAGVQPAHVRIIFIFSSNQSLSPNR